MARPRGSWKISKLARAKNGRLKFRRFGGLMPMRGRCKIHYRLRRLNCTSGKFDPTALPHGASIIPPRFGCHFGMATGCQAFALILRYMQRDLTATLRIVWHLTGNWTRSVLHSRRTIKPRWVHIDRTRSAQARILPRKCTSEAHRMVIPTVPMR